MDQYKPEPRWPIDQTRANANNKLSVAWQAMSKIELRTLTGMLFRQWRLILSVYGITLLLVLALLSQTSYRYTAEALMTIDERGSELIGQSDSLGSGVTFNNRVDSEVEILSSSSVALGVVDRLALWRDDEFGFKRLSLTTKLKSLIGLKSPQENLPDALRLNEFPGEKQAGLAALLQRNLRIERRGLTSVISIKATSKDGDKAALIANTVAESYLDIQLNAKAKTAQSAVDFLGQRVEELAKSLQETNEKTENFILDQSAAVGTPEAKQEMLRIRDQIKKLSSDEADFSTLLTKLQSFQQDSNSPIPENFPAELRAVTEERNAAAKEAFANAADENLQSRLKDLDLKVKEAAATKANEIQSQLASSDKQRDQLRKLLQDIFTHQQIPNEVSVNLFRLQRDADSNRKMYDTLSGRLAEVRQQVGLTLPNSRIVAPAISPSAPSFPPSQTILFAASLLGLGLGVAAAIGRENLVGGFAMAAQVEAVTGLPVIATIPKDTNQNPQDTLVDDPFSAFSESVRRMRLGVEERVSTSGQNVVLVTSTEPGEGKSTLALSLARAMASVGKRVILVDCDFRHPSVGRLSGLASPINLVDYLVDGKLPEDSAAVAAEDTVSSLLLITTSASKSQASDVIVNSKRFRQFIESLASSFDAVILDSPPIGYVVDARILAEMSDFLLYVIKQNSTSQQDAVGGLRQVLHPTNQGQVGLVLNSVQNVLAGYYYGDSRSNNYYRKK
jgi:capsular exopolysaccharide synthesis family protein